MARLNKVLNKAGQLAFQVADMQEKLVALQERVNKLSKDGETQMALNVKLSEELRQRMETLAQAEQYPVTSPEQPTANGKLYWNKKSKTWQIFLTSVKPAEAGKTYELWIVTADHKLAAGTANVDDQGRLYFEAKTLPDTPLLAAAITDEQSKGEPDDGAKGKVQFLAKLPTP